MSHSGTINHNPDTGTSSSTTSSLANKSAALWLSLRTYYHSIKGTSVTTFEKRQPSQISRTSSGSPLGSVVREDLEATTVSSAKFYAALSAQYSDAIGTVYVQQGSVHGAVIAFGSLEAHTKTYSIGIIMDGFTFISTPTLPASSSIHRLSLDKLPIRRPNELAPLLTNVINAYGRVLHVGLLLDPQTNLFFGKGYALLDVTTDDTQSFSL